MAFCELANFFPPSSSTPTTTGPRVSGVRGIRLQHDKDEVVGMVSVNDMDSNILVVSTEIDG